MMKRQPINVHVFLYRPGTGGYEFAILQRADLPGCWQGISGGLLEGETPAQAALRVSAYEVGTPLELPLYRLDSVSTVPAENFGEHQKDWGPDVVVVPMYYFAMPYDGEICLTGQHLAYKWMTFEEAEPIMYWQGQKNALWELKERLRRGNLKAAE